MRRDSRTPAQGDAAGEADALLTAYVDGVAELPPDERRAVEARLADEPAARGEADAVKSVLDRLRALPPTDGDEPDWAAMERSIRLAVAGEPVRPWWRRWRWLVPAMTCATAAAVLIVIWPHTEPTVRQPSSRPVAEWTEPDLQATDVVALWLDGSEVDVDLSAPDPLGEVGPDLDALNTPAGASDDEGDVGLLPASDLAWVDHLDDAALDRAERWLAARGRTGGSSGPTGRDAEGLRPSPQSPHRKKS